VIDFGDHVTGREADESRWQRRYPPYARTGRGDAAPTVTGIVVGVYPDLDGVVKVVTAERREVLIRDARMASRPLDPPAGQAVAAWTAIMEGGA